MPKWNKWKVVAALVAVTSLGIAATTPPKGEFKNLKVLPKDISSKTLYKIMIDDFEDGLGVSCAFCHAEQKGSHKLDYVSDENPQKQIARLMMRMTMGVNKKYFKMKHPQIGDSTLVISCSTCHNGQARPSEDSSN